MALATNTQFHISATATTGNVNGAGFNPLNTNMLTNLTTDSNTANTASPVVSSASYNFVAGDVGHWLYIKSGTNWIPGWYQIASVATNKATLSAAIGAAQILALTFKAPSTVIGCATVGTPTSGTFAIDYSQGNTAIINGSVDFTSTASSTTVSSVSDGFTAVMVGNFYHQTTTGTGGFGIIGWYEIISVTSSTALVLDRTPNTGTTSVACTGYIGGAGRFNGLEDDFGEMVPSGAKINIKNGTYVLSGSIAIASTNGTSTDPIWYLGFNTIPGDAPMTTNRPTITAGANTISWGSYTYLKYMITTGSGATVVTLPATTGSASFCKFFNTSTTVNRSCFVGSAGLHQFCEFISQNGSCTTAKGTFYGCYFHDSATGFTGALTDVQLLNCVLAALNTTAFTSSSATGLNIFSNNTFYGRLSTPTGVGINFSAAAGAVNNRIFNNIIAGFATGISISTVESFSNLGGYNDMFGNTADTSNYTRDPTGLSLDPGFIDVTEIAISNGTITGGTAVLTSSGADFSSVEDGVDFFRIISNTGGTGTFIANYLITSHTATTLTFNNNAGTSGSATSVVGFVQTGHNYQIGTNLKAQGFPGLVAGSATTSYTDIGGVQRQEAGGSSATVGYASVG